jgi:hypothetical protein
MFWQRSSVTFLLCFEFTLWKRCTYSYYNNVVMLHIFLLHCVWELAWRGQMRDTWLILTWLYDELGAKFDFVSLELDLSLADLIDAEMLHSTYILWRIRWTWNCNTNKLLMNTSRPCSTIVFCLSCIEFIRPIPAEWLPRLMLQPPQWTVEFYLE